MYQDVVFINGPIVRAVDDGIRVINQYYEFSTVNVKAKLIGRPFYWVQNETETGGFSLVFEGFDGSIHIQQVQFLLYFDSDSRDLPHTLYYHNQFTSLAEARASALGWLIEWALGVM